MIPLDYPLYDLDGWGGNYLDDFGVEWIITAEDGWGGPADARADITDKPRQDGADDGPTYESSRVITLTGKAIAPSWAEQNAAKDRLNAAAYTGRGLYPLTVTEQHLSRLAYVRRSGAQKVTDAPGFAFDFSISLVAPDPRKYAVDEEVAVTTMSGIAVPVGRTYPRTYPLTYPAATSMSPTVLVANAGNRSTGAVITFSSGIDNPGVINTTTGAQLQVAVSLGASDSLAIDLSEQTVIFNETASRRGSLYAGSAWFALEPGNNALRMIGSPNGTGSPTMTVRFRSAWK